ncbi:MAG: Crp/Fnr family transcriptional regulator [Anaerovoracaceae bacterium]|nr:Crp/Fnr family transcriptional regulator [Anaerovoracaceae bacterium]
MQQKNILDDISIESLKLMVPCFAPVFRKFKRGETIMQYEGGEPKTISVMVLGTARLEIIDEDGEAFNLESYRRGDVFGELFALPLENLGYSVIATSDCTIMNVDYHHFISPCEKTCDHHTTLISNLFIMTAQKSQELALHLTILSQNCIRAKLMTYLRYARSCADATDDQEFEIPMSLSQLADYIRADRSSMMREIKAMKSDGLIESKARSFRLLA